MKIIIALVYIIGMIISYILSRWTYRKFCNENELEFEWIDVRFLMVISLLSWFGAFSAFIMALLCGHIKIFKDKTKPPTWL